MNKKGFTLVEILATIVLISLLLGLGIPGVMKISENMKKRSYNTKVDLIEQAGILWGQDNKTRLQSDDCKIDGKDYKCKKIVINELLENDYLDYDNNEEFLDPRDNNDISDKCIYIYKKNNRVYSEFSPDDSECKTKIYATLKNTILTDDRIIKNYTNPSFNTIATTELGMYKASDDYGDSWYFRGKQSYNYVNFAGFTWRIVRINGNDSIKLILNRILEDNSECGDSTVCINSSFNPKHRYNAYIGYMYGLENVTNDENRCLVLNGENIEVKTTEINYSSKNDCERNGGKWVTTAYEATHANIKSSNIKTTIDAFYEKYLKNNFNKYLDDVIFCGNKTITTNTKPQGSGLFASTPSNKGYGEENTYYAIYDNIIKSVSTLKDDLKPTLKCNGEVVSMYSVESHNINGTYSNGDLNYPIGLLTADEYIMAGGNDNKNKDFYLNNKSSSMDSWWLMNPVNSTKEVYGAGDVDKYYYTQVANVHFTFTKGSWLSFDRVSYKYGVRPVINLKSNVLVESGTGTINDPYIIKIN